MSSPNHLTFDIEDAFSSNFLASPDYFPASLGNTSSESSNNSSGLVPIASPTLSLFHNDPYMKVMQAYDAINFFPLEEIPPPKDTETPVESPIPISPSSSVGSSSPVRSTTPPPDYPFDESIFAELDNSLWIIPRPLGSEPVPEESNEMSPKRTSTSTAPAMTHAAIKVTSVDIISSSGALVLSMANTDNTNRNTEEREALVARKLFSRSNCIEDCKVKFATGTLTEEALSWWNSFAQPIRIEEAYKITWVEFKKLLIKKYCPRTEVQKIEDEFYHLTVKGNDLKKYVRRFQELANLCPTMVPNTEKHMEAFVGGLPRSIEANVTASKPQNLEEAINITQRLMDQVTRYNFMQGTNDHKRKFDDRITFNNNNYQNDRNNNNDNHNNDHHQQQNRRQETFRAYAATPTKNHGTDVGCPKTAMYKLNKHLKLLHDSPPPSAPRPHHHITITPAPYKHLHHLLASYYHKLHTKVMSSPNHPTSDIKDAFSSNFLNYIPASPDYFPASPGNTSYESSNKSSGLVPIALPTLLLFHNDPDMKVMQAYDAISPPQVTIPPPTVVPPSSMFTTMFDSRDFFPPDEIHHLKTLRLLLNHPF
ncbi:reverse transcriptase domain-containing protein [Tanacetum coccineum]